MANYISNEILAEAYTHLDIDTFQNKPELEKLRRDLTSFFQERASFLFGTDVNIKVEFEEGSLKTRIIATGSLAAALVAGYPNFRAGISHLSGDASMLAHSANMEVVFRTRTAPCDRIRIEKRKGVFGRVDALITELDAAASLIANVALPRTHVQLKHTSDATAALLAWDNNVDRLFSKFDDPETELCVAQGLLEELAQLPRSVPWYSELNGRGIRANMTRSDPHLAGLIDGEAARYAATIKAIEKKLKTRTIVAKN